ncbi:MAG TPA: DUF58 domain-containing protein [Phycisphaerales bacterium]|nr:DUF58 domain-containing protein [Phycisphaerales bacterium]
MKNRVTPLYPTVVFVVLLLLVAPSAFFQGKNLPMWLFGAMVVTMVMTFVWTKIVLRGISVRRIILEPAKVGEPYVVRYEVKNISRWIAGFSLWIEEQQTKDSTWQKHFRKARGWIMEVGAGETVHGEAIFWPTSRGEATFQFVRITTSFPFGMVRSSKLIRQDVVVLVKPEVKVLRPSVLNAIVSSGPLGQRSNRRGRGGDDFFGLRELVGGDRLGDIAWKASARRGELVCIQRSKPALPRVRIVLDLTTPTSALNWESDLRKLEEDAISLCASLVVEAVRQEQEVALSVLGFSIQGVDSFHSSQRHVSRLLSSLARIQLDNTREPIQLRALASMKQSGLVVIRPDRSEPIRSIKDAWYFTASQFKELQRSAERSVSA